MHRTLGITRLHWFGAALLLVLVGCGSSDTNTDPSPSDVLLGLEACVFNDSGDDSCTVTTVVDFGELPLQTTHLRRVRLTNTTDAAVSLQDTIVASGSIILDFVEDSLAVEQRVLVATPVTLESQASIVLHITVETGGNEGPLPADSVDIVGERDGEAAQPFRLSLIGSVKRCISGYIDCDSNEANGCETDLSNDIAHCGECNRACETEFGVSVCVGGECQVECEPGYTGPTCNVDIDECIEGSHTCHQEATCENTEGGFNCTCGSGYEGNGFLCTPVPALIETELSSVTTTPDQPIDVICTLTNKHGDPVDLVDLVDAIDLVVSEVIAVEQVGPGSFRVTGTVAGTYEVACRLGDIVDKDPVSFNLLPGLAHSWSVDVPSLTCNKPGTILALEVVVSDVYGNEIDDPGYSVTTTPPSMLSELIAGTILFDQEGSFDMTVAYLGEVDPAGTIAPATLGMHVDGSRPSLVITTPDRAATLVGAAGSEVTIQGSVVDSASPLVGLEINGVVQDVADDSSEASFNVVQTSNWGLNIISAWAEDACGQSIRVVQSYLHSSDYYAASTTPAIQSTVLHGIVGRLNQAFIDDLNPFNSTDIAHLAEDVMQNTDLDAMLPEPLAVNPDGDGDGYIDFVNHSCGLFPITWTETNQRTGFRAVKTGFLTYGDPVIEYVRAVDGGLKIAMYIDDISLPLWIHGHLDLGCAGENGADVNGFLDVDKINLLVDAEVYLENGEPQISTCDECVEVSFTGLYFDIDWGILNFMGGALDGVANLIIDRFEDNLAEKLSETVAEQLIPKLEEFLGQFQVDTQLPLLPMLDVDLSIASSFDYVEFSGPAGAGYGTLGLGTQVYPATRAVGIPFTAKGSIQKDGEFPTFSSSGYTFGVGLSDDLINQVFWALWYGGGFKIEDATALLGQNFSDLEISVEALAPPVLMPGDDEHEIYVGVGDVYVEAEATLAPFGTLNVGLFASVIVPGAIDVDPTTNELMFIVTGETAVHVQLTDLNELDALGDLQAYFEGVLAMLTPNLLAQSIGLIPLPVFDVGNLLGLPAGTVWGLENASATRLSDYTRFTGNVGEQ